MTLKLTKEELRPNRPHQSQYPGQFKWRNSIQLEHHHWLGVIAQHHGSRCVRSPPLRLLSKRNLPITKIHSDVGLRASIRSMAEMGVAGASVGNNSAS